MDHAQNAEIAPTPWEWGVEWDDGVIAYDSEEIARQEQRFPTRPDHVNPRLVRRAVGPWLPADACTCAVGPLDRMPLIDCRCPQHSPVAYSIACWCRPGSPELPVSSPHEKNDRCSQMTYRIPPAQDGADQ